MSPLKKTKAHISDDSVILELFQHEDASSTPKSSRSGRSLNISGDGLLPLDIMPNQSCLQSPTNSVDSNETDDDAQELTGEAEQAQRETFHKARQYLRPSRMLRYIIYLFGERKLLAFFCVHFVCTMAIFAHFFLVKLDEKALAVPVGVDRYWWKRIVPPLEFGTMHAILFQMTLVPLTMCRYSIARISESAIERFLPLKRVVRMHVYLGYTICLLLVLSTIVFLIFFGVLCSDGDQKFCDKFTSEIMCTGYGIIGAVLLILGTSYFRNKIPYEAFYAIHHLVFVFYALTIAHTLDDKQRHGEEQRSQTFKWFSSTLLYYLCDRIAMHLNNRYTATLISSSTIQGGNGSRMIILRLRKPALFNFKPGQYAFLKLRAIDAQWHPFSIASGPGSSILEFYIEVFGKKSWTDKLWNVLEGDGEGDFSEKLIEVEILGPCGTSLAKMEDYSNSLAIGTGTGIVPILSLYKQHVRQLMRLEPWTHFSNLDSHRRKLISAERALAPRRGPLAKKIALSCAPIYDRRNAIDVATSMAVAPDDSLADSIRNQLNKHSSLMRWRDVRGSIRDMQHAAFQATRSIYGVVLLALLPAMGTFLMGFTISCNTTSADLHDGINRFVHVLTIIFQAIFAYISLFIWNGNDLFALIDASMCIVAPFADWYWCLQAEANEGNLRPGDITLFCLLIGYMTFRLWSKAVEPRHTSWRKTYDTDGIGALETLEVVWVSRSASLVSELMPDINCIWDALAERWGKHNASKACKFSVYVTDTDEKACELLRRELSVTQLFQDGAIRFGRPDFATLIEDHTLRLICTRKQSYSLLAFCGSQEVAEEIHHHKISNDLTAAITGNRAHQMEFVSESYGGSRREHLQTPDDATSSGLTTRTVISYHKSTSRKFLI